MPTSYLRIFCLKRPSKASSLRNTRRESVYLKIFPRSLQLICAYLSRIEKPALYINNTVIFPGLTKILNLQSNPGVISVFDNAFGGDRKIVVMPPVNDQETYLSCLCNVVNYHLIGNVVRVQLQGVVRFHVHAVKNLQGEGVSLTVAEGHPVTDNQHSSLESLREVTVDILAKNKEILAEMPVNYLKSIFNQLL